MPSMPVRRHSAVIVLALLATAVYAAEERPGQVTKLRGGKVALYNCDDSSTKVKEISQQEFISKQEFKGPWPIDPNKKVEAGLLPVTVDGKPYCVRVYSVETDKRINATSECGALVAANTPKSAATRGVGEGCQPNKK
jgi:hypothetical protein